MQFKQCRQRVAPTFLLLCAFCFAVSAGAEGPPPISVLKNQNMYERLGLKPGATTAEIKKAYGDFRRANAAAINGSDPAIQDRAGLIGEAFQKLRKEESRRAYDGAMGFDSPGDSNAQASPADDYARRQKPLSVADEELIAQLYDIPDGPLNPAVQKQVFDLLDSKTIDPRVADEVTNVLFRVGEWDAAIWAQVDEKFDELSGRWRDLSFAIENQKQWPPIFANKVRLALDPGAGAMTQKQIHQAELKRDLAVDLFLSRKKSEIPPTVLSALDADLSTPHNSSSFKSALPRLLRLEKKEISRTKAMDEKLMAAMKKIFRQKISAAGGEGPYPNEIIHVFVQSRELPKGLWEVLREEAATAADAGPVITAADILAQRHDMPEDVKTVLYRRIADARTRAVPQTFNRGDGTTKVSLEFFHLDSRNIQWDPLESTCRHASLSIL